MSHAHKLFALSVIAMVTAGFLFMGSAEAGPRVGVTADLSSPLLLADQESTAYLKIGLRGLGTAAGAPVALDRAPVNVAIVLDRSGSMSGEKLWRAKDAAKTAVAQLGSEDIVSVVIYDDTVEVLVPATKAVDKADILRRIDGIQVGGNTALFAGVSKGAAEVRKFRDVRRASRVILLSDGLANVGPSSPHELESLGYSLLEEGISVSTVGLGLDYNEDLMARLARASDGNHGFAQTPDDLLTIFRHEFGDLLSVMARDVRIDLRLQGGARPVRVLGRDARVEGDRVVARLGQIYTDQEKFILVEVRTPKAKALDARQLAAVEVRFTDPSSGAVETLKAVASARFSASQDAVLAAENKDVAVASIELLANERSREALRLRDQGQTAKAEEVLRSNAASLRKSASKYQSKKLDKLSADFEDDSLNLNESQWKSRRKAMTKSQHAVDNQQAW